MGVRKAKYRCNGCGKNRPSSKFSNKQFSKKSDVRRCRDCIKAEVKTREIKEHREMVQSESWQKWSKEVADAADRAAVDLVKKWDLERPSNRIGLVDVIETATASWCPHCGTRMEGGPGGRRKWFCPGCGQLFDANGNAVN